MQAIENTLKTRIENDKAHTFVVVVPTDAARLHRQRELVNYHPNGAVANLRVLDIENFVQRLYNQVRPSRQHISQGIQNLWLHDIANNSDVSAYEEFQPDPNIPVPDSTLSLIAGTINRLKERGEGTQNIGNGKSSNPTDSDLICIYNEYENKLENRWIDEQGKYLHLANNFKSQFMRRAFPGVNLIVVEGFAVLSKANIKILTHIAKMPQIEMWFRTDYVKENQALYKNIGELVSEFKAANVAIDPDYEREPNRHEHFAKHLFRTETVSANPIANPQASYQIKMLRPADRSEEIEQIASLIQKHVSAGHCKLNDICVAYYNIGPYQQRIAETFPAYSIPYSLVENVPLTKSEVVKAIFSRLSSDRTPLDDAYFSCVEPASQETNFHPKQFQEYVDKLLKKGNVLRRILNPMLGKNSEIVEGEVEAYRQFQRIFTELCNVLRSESERSYPLSEYINKLQYIARHTNYRSKAAVKGETVKIAQLGELRNMEFDTVFLGDFVESRFPENYRPDPLLPEIPYRDEEELLCDNRFLFYRVLKSFRERLYLLVPQREREAELIASPFLGQLKAIADIDETEKIPNPSQGSVTGFLSTYGNHVWTAPTAVNGEFPAEIANMRSLIDHVVAIEKSREETHKHLAYEGVLTAGTLSAKSLGLLQSLRSEPHSVTDLETYAKCPFQYFFRNILQFYVKEDEAEDELSSLDKGSLLHNILRAFYNSRREQGDPDIEQCNEDVFREAEGQLNRLLDNEAENHRNKRSTISENNLFWKTDIEKLSVRLHKWLKAERTKDLPAIPRYYEVPFGKYREPEDAVQLTGRIDRIDVDTRIFNIVDYKTGSSVPKIQAIREGRALQLPIYLKMAAQWLREHETLELESASALYYTIRLDQFKTELGIGKKSLNGIAFKNYNGTKWGNFGSSNGQLLEDDDFAEILNRVSGYVQQYVDSISNGIFPLITRVETFVDSAEEGDAPITPKDKTAPCSYCDYKRVCRVGAISETPQSDD